MWKHQHVIGHHALPNHIDVDNDTFSNFLIMRTNPKLPIRYYNQFQHLYFPFLYTLLGISYPIGDFKGYISGKYEKILIQPLRNIDKIWFFSGKLFHYFFTVILPIYMHGLNPAIFMFYFPMQLVGSFYLASLFAVSHNNSVSDYNVDVGEKEWAEVQVITSANWSVGSTMWMLLSGGLNYQIEHHLFPGVTHVHYPAISKIVRKICEENNVKYNAYPTFTSLFIDHAKTLKILGTWKQ